MRLRNSQILVAAAFALSLLAAGTASADRDRWVLLGERIVSDKLDHDLVPVTARRGEFEALRLRVEGHAVQFHKVTVHFANGGDQELELREVIPAGGESRAIDLAGHDRVIRSIEFVYDSQSLSGQSATVRVFGRR